MQHRASTPVRGRHRRTDPLPGAPVPSAPVPDATRAYLDLLASTAPLIPADLLRDPAAEARDASRPATGPAPRRRDVGSHRAPSRPIAPALLGDRGRYAVAAAAIAAGVGVAGIATAATPGRAADAGAVAVAAPARTPAAALTDLAPGTTPSSPASAGTALATQAPGPPTTDPVADAYGAPTVETVPGAADPALGAVRAARKARPVPVPVAQWVDPMPGAATTSCFGQRWGRLHAGVDLAAPHGTPIRAAGAGVVVSAGAAAGYGNAVLIDHGNGYLTHYGHLATITVTAGQKLAVGEQIGTEGSTGHSTGPHLHFEVHEGSYKNPVEPTAWMHEHGVTIGGCGQA